MESIVINGTPRTELGKKATRALRRAGNVPCNLYGGAQTTNFFAPVTDFKKLIYTSELRLAEITVDGKTTKAIVKDLQFDPVTDELLHIDFQELVDGVKVRVSVPLQFTGTPKGVSTGGKLEQVLRRLAIKAEPKNLVSAITVDVTDMDLGSVKRIRDIDAPNIEIVLASSNPIARIAVPRAAKEAAESAKDEKKK